MRQPRKAHRTIQRIVLMLAFGVCWVLAPLRTPTAAASTDAQRVIITLTQPDTLPALQVEPVQLARRRTGIARQQAQMLMRHTDLAQTSLRRLTSMPVIIADATPDQIVALQADASVASVRVSRLYAPVLTESTTRIGVRVARAAGYAGAGTSVAVLDTGVAKTHPFLVGSVVQEACFSTRSSAYDSTPLCPGATELSTSEGSGLPCPDGLGGCDHGTHVAGIIAGRPTVVDGLSMSGVAPATKIIAIQVFTRFDYTNAAQVCGSAATQDCVLSFESDVLSALDYLATNQTTPAWGTMAAVNLSLGADPIATSCDADIIDGMGTYKSYVDALRSLGVATVIAAGNDGNTNGISHPGCVSSAVTVGSTDTLRAGLEHEDDVSSFSNAPSVTANLPNAQGDRLLDILAPGGSIQSAMAYPSGSYSGLSGTSMAAPHVAGAWAVLKGIAPTASVSQLQTILRDTGVTISDTRRSAADPLIVPRVAVDAAIAAIRADQIPVNLSAIGLEYAAVQRGTSAVQRIILRYRGTPVRITRAAVLAPWSVTPFGCSTLIDDIADTCILEVRYAPGITEPLGYVATSITLTLNGKTTRIGLSAQTVSAAPARALTQTALVENAAQTRTMTQTPSPTPASHAAAQTIVANATRTRRRQATSTAVRAATQQAAATHEAETGVATLTYTPHATSTAAVITKTIGAARTATTRRNNGLTQTVVLVRTKTAALYHTATAQSAAATAEVDAGSPSRTSTRTPTATRAGRSVTPTTTRTRTRGPTLSPTTAPIVAQSVTANGRYQGMIVRNVGTMGVLIHSGNRLSNDTPLLTLVRLGDLQFGTGVALDGQNVTALSADPLTTDRLYIAGRLDWGSGYLQTISVASGRMQVRATTVFPLPPGSDVRSLQAIGRHIWVGVALSQGPALLLNGQLRGFDSSLTPLLDAPIAVAGIPTSILPIDGSDERLVVAGRVDTSTSDTGFLQVLSWNGVSWSANTPIGADLPFSAGSATNLLADAERTVLLSMVDGVRIALYTLAEDNAVIWRNHDVRTPASLVHSDSGRIVALGYSVGDRKNILTVYQPLGDMLLPRRAAALTNPAGGIAGIAIGSSWLYLLDALRLTRTNWP